MATIVMFKQTQHGNFQTLLPDMKEIIHTVSVVLAQYAQTVVLLTT